MSGQNARGGASLLHWPRCSRICGEEERNISSHSAYFQAAALIIQALLLLLSSVMSAGHTFPNDYAGFRLTEGSERGGKVRRTDTTKAPGEERGIPRVNAASLSPEEFYNRSDDLLPCPANIDKPHPSIGTLTHRTRSMGSFAACAHIRPALAMSNMQRYDGATRIVTRASNSFVSTRRPCVLTDGMLEGAKFDKWTAKYLKKVAGKDEVEVRAASRVATRVCLSIHASSNRLLLSYLCVLLSLSHTLG